MSFMAILDGIVPVFLLIALGYGLKKSGFLPLNVWGPIEKFAVYVLYPGFLVPAIWHANLDSASAGPIGLACLCAVLIAAAFGLLLKPFLKVSGPTYTSIFQGLIRFNAFVFIPVISAIYGADVMSVAAVALSALIPTVNFLCILVLARWGEPEDGRVVNRSLTGVLQALVTNPIFVACMTGLALNLLRVPEIAFLGTTLSRLGEAAIPTGLILAGAGLSFGYAFARPVLIGSITAFKLLVMPILTWGLCVLFGGDALAQGIALGCGATPSAAAGYVLARHMGGDAPLMAGIVALTTTLSALTLPILLIVLHLV